MVQPAQSSLSRYTSGRQGVRSAAWRFLLEPKMGTIFVVQVDNTTAIILNLEKSVTLGIRGTNGLWQFTKPSADKSVTKTRSGIHCSSEFPFAKISAQRAKERT